MAALGHRLTPGTRFEELALRLAAEQIRRETGVATGAVDLIASVLLSGSFHSLRTSRYCSLGSGTIARSLLAIAGRRITATRDIVADAVAAGEP